MKRLRVLVLLVAMWLAVGSPALVGWEHRARPAEAQGGPVEVAITAACLGLSGGYCILLWGAVAYGALAARYYGVELPSNPEDFVDSMKEWVTGGSPGAQQFALQYTAHPYTCLITDNMAAEWDAAIDALALSGWSSTENWYSTGYEVWEKVLAAGVQTVLRTPYADMPTGVNCSYGNGIGGRNVHDPDGQTTASSLDWVYDDGASHFDLAAYFNFDSTRDTHNMNGSLGGGACAMLGTTGYFELTMPGGTPWPPAGKKALFTDLVFQFAFIVDGVDPEVSVFMEDFGLTGGAMLEIEGATIRAPMVADDAYTWDGVSAMPLADGTTAMPVIEGVLPAPVEKDWWEGLFGGIAAPLGGIKDVLGDIWTGVQGIAGDVANVWEWAQALPQTLVEAISAAVVPAESVSARVSELETGLSGKAPFAWPGLVFTMAGSLFDGGAGCPTLSFPTSAMGMSSDVEMEMCLPSGVKTVVYLCWDLVATLLVAEWAWNAYRRIVGS